MFPRTRSNVLPCTLLAAVCALPATAFGDGPDTVLLPGMIRDFKKTNTDFKTVPNGGYGHYAGNIGLTIGGTGRPVFVGTGYKVNNQWRNSGNEPIPPHLYAAGGPAGGVVQVATAPTVNNNPLIDSWDSSEGAYGGSNVGPAPVWAVGSEMPTVSPPSPLPNFIQDIMYDGNGTSNLGQNRYCKTFTLQNNRTLNITSNIFIYCTETFTIQNYAKLKINNNAALTVYIGKNCTIQNNVELNLNTFQPSKLKIINLGTSTIVLENNADLCAQIISPNAPLHLKNNCDFYGNFTGQSMIIDNSAGFHNDGSGGSQTMMCGAPLNDSAGSKGLNSTGGIPNGAAFNTWYNDVPSTNLSAMHSIELTKNAQGIYEYLDDSFHPIDNILFGNEGEAHNHYFTYTIDAEFVHHACQNPGTFFEFQGADDAWLFIDGKLAMDLGGMIPGTSQYVEIDRIAGLVDGETYSIQFFYAQRQPNIASFNIKTNMDIVGSDLISTVSAGCD